MFFQICAKKKNHLQEILLEIWVFSSGIDKIITFNRNIYQYPWDLKIFFLKKWFDTALISLQNSIWDIYSFPPQNHRTIWMGKDLKNQWVQYKSNAAQSLLKHDPNCHINIYLQDWWLNHFPGHLVPVPQKLFSEGIFPSMQSEASLGQLKAISSCPVIHNLGEETDPSWLRTPFRYF